MQVYFIQEGKSGPIKIGRAKDPEKRLITMQIGNGSELCLLKSYTGTSKEESRLHKKFKHLRIRGEWFEPGDDLLQFLSARNQAKPGKQFTQLRLPGVTQAQVLGEDECLKRILWLNNYREGKGAGPLPWDQVREIFNMSDARSARLQEKVGGSSKHGEETREPVGS